MLKRFLAALLLFPALHFCQAQPASIAPQRFEFGFNQGGKLRLDLGAGDVDVVGSPENKIIVTYMTSRPDQAKNVHVETNLKDTWGTVKVSGPHNNFKYTVQIPQKTNLYLRLSAGDLDVKGITGSKDIESHAGDIRVEAGDPAHYGEVDASVTMGDLNMPRFGVNKGGISRSYKTTGKGEYRLHVHLWAGDLNVD
jgi:Putative adhesin